LIGTATVIGISTPDLYRMSMWEFAAAVAGWNRAHGDNKTRPPTDEEFDEAVRRVEEARVIH
jgi:hypothetical protein